MLDKYIEILYNWISYIILLILDPFFRNIYSNKIIFNISWEDPRLDVEALKLTNADEILVITSGGCNVLHLALSGVKHIYAVDCNPCQNALLELKIVAIKYLEYDDFWKMFGEGKLNNFSTKIYPILRKHLSPFSRQFWDKHATYFDGTGIRKSFYHHGCTGFIVWLLQTYCYKILGIYKDALCAVNAPTLEEQSRYYNKFRSRIWNKGVMWLLQNKIFLLISGVPLVQRQFLEKEGVGNFLRKALDALAYDIPVQDNYFWRVYCLGSYTKNCCPEYLKEYNFKLLKGGLVDNISIHTTTITEFLNSRSGKISRFVLLDHMDWMANKPQLLEEEWQEIINHSAPNARYIWRSAAQNTDFVFKTQIKYNGKITDIGQIINSDIQLAENLHKLDRVHTYTSFYIAELKN